MLSKDILSDSGCSFRVWALIYGPGKIKIKTAKFFETSSLLTSKWRPAGGTESDMSLFAQCCWVRTQEVRPYLFISDGIFLWAHLDQISFFCTTESNHQGYGLKLIVAFF